MTGFVNLTLGDFLRFIQGLLPRGAAWTRDDDAVLTQVAQRMADQKRGQVNTASGNRRMFLRRPCPLPAAVTPLG